VEFDGRGDHIDRDQHHDAYSKVLELAEKQPLLLVIYCHGWKNNSQSGDVVEFNTFLSDLASTQGHGSEPGERQYRVHGVYLSWRGNPVRPFVNKRVRSNYYKEFYQKTLRDFGEPIVDARYHRRLLCTGLLSENLSYWLRKGAAEHQVSSVAMARTILWCATAAKTRNRESVVWVMGHSMGALMLERALLPTFLSTLADRLPWWSNQRPVAAGGDEADSGGASPHTPPQTDRRLVPYDLLMFVNSAAPAIYAKQARDTLASIQEAYRDGKRADADAPLVISLTSKADGATRRLHLCANCLARFYPSLRRTYSGTETGLENAPPGFTQHQSSFYKRTPGHHPLLVDHWITPLPEGSAPEGAPSTFTDQTALFDFNLGRGLTTDPFAFATRRPGEERERWWRLVSEPASVDVAGEPASKWRKDYWTRYPGHHTGLKPSKYWIVRCGGQLIGSHNDIWGAVPANLYAALFRIAQRERSAGTAPSPPSDAEAHR
jgi:hypothetical protein